MRGHEQKGKELEKNRVKAQESAVAFCSRLGCYRQSFAWAALPVFSRSTLALQELNNFTLYPAHPKDNIYDQLLELRVRRPPAHALRVALGALLLTALTRTNNRTRRPSARRFRRRARCGCRS